MTKKQFDKIFAESKKETFSLTQEQIREKLTNYQTNEGKISMENLAMFAYIESINASTELLYSVLLQVLDIKD